MRVRVGAAVHELLHPGVPTSQGGGGEEWPGTGELPVRELLLHPVDRLEEPQGLGGGMGPEDDLAPVVQKKAEHARLPGLQEQTVGHRGAHLRSAEPLKFLGDPFRFRGAEDRGLRKRDVVAG